MWTRDSYRMRAAGRHAALALALLGAAVTLSGCKTTSAQRGTDITTSSISSAEERPASLREVMELRKRWKKRPGDARIGLQLADALKRLGQRDEQVEILKKVVEANPTRHDLRQHYAIELLRANRAVQAEQQLRRLLSSGQRNWKTFNALGSALAAQGRYDEARRNFLLALKVAPDNPKILNNLAMSYLLDSRPREAEKYLRQAMKLARGKLAMKVRQNLALALGLQGRFEEARYLASHDLPPKQVEINMAYLREMLGNGQAWQKISGTQPGGARPEGAQTHGAGPGSSG